MSWFWGPFGAGLARALVERQELALAVTAFRTWFRLTNHHPGRPDYPEEPITWATIAEYLEMVPFLMGGVACEEARDN